MHILQSLLHVVQVGVSYALMLVFMTFNVWLCVALCVGAGKWRFFVIKYLVCMSDLKRMQPFCAHRSFLAFLCHFFCFHNAEILSHSIYSTSYCRVERGRGMIPHGFHRALLATHREVKIGAPCGSKSIWNQSPLPNQSLQ